MVVIVVCGWLLMSFRRSALTLRMMSTPPMAFAVVKDPARVATAAASSAMEKEIFAVVDRSLGAVGRPVMDAWEEALAKGEPYDASSLLSISNGGAGSSSASVMAASFPNERLMVNRPCLIIGGPI